MEHIYVLVMLTFMNIKIERLALSQIYLRPNYLARSSPPLSSNQPAPPPCCPLLLEIACVQIMSQYIAKCYANM